MARLTVKAVQCLGQTDIVFRFKALGLRYVVFQPPFHINDSADRSEENLYSNYKAQKAVHLILLLAYYVLGALGTCNSFGCDNISVTPGKEA